ncbi:hypothetical protein PUN28_004017 [Cardiocondyla obscurior]|uniref:Uncharacterized protein n=1 Tax=Cardiocondyla obscurior TaxID=286306 RepID=A0AAW2GLB4_9HYME
MLWKYIDMLPSLLTLKFSITGTFVLTRRAVNRRKEKKEKNIAQLLENCSYITQGALNFNLIQNKREIKYVSDVKTLTAALLQVVRIFLNKSPNYVDLTHCQLEGILVLRRA